MIPEAFDEPPVTRVHLRLESCGFVFVHHTLLLILNYPLINSNNTSKQHQSVYTPMLNSTYTTVHLEQITQLVMNNRVKYTVMSNAFNLEGDQVGLKDAYSNSHTQWDGGGL